MADNKIITLDNLKVFKNGIEKEIPEVPTAVSAFTNDAGYVTDAYHDSSKQDLLDTDNKLDLDYVDVDFATEDDIDNLFPEDVSTFTDITTLNSDPEVTKVNICLADNINAGSDDLTFRKDAHIDLDGHTLSFDDWGVEIRNGKTLTVEGGTITSVEAPFYAREAATLVIENGNYSATNNYVVGTNGSSGKGDNTITINGGTFNSSMSAASQEKGYIACGVYVANNDTVEIKAGTFNIVDGVGILARSGNTIVHNGVVVNVSGAGKSGYVGDSKILVPAGNAYVLDLVANYPGGSPSITVNGITVNAENYTETAAEAGVVVITA